MTFGQIFILRNSLLKPLAENLREVIYALFWEGTSQRALAKSLKLARPTVQIYQRRALQKVARHLIEVAREVI